MIHLLVQAMQALWKVGRFGILKLDHARRNGASPGPHLCIEYLCKSTGRSPTLLGQFGWSCACVHLIKTNLRSEPLSRQS